MYGENKTHSGNDFRVSLLSKDSDGMQRLQAAKSDRKYLGGGSGGWGLGVPDSGGGLGGASRGKSKKSGKRVQE